MLSQELEQVLNKASLRITKARLFVLAQLTASKWALAHKELEESAPKELDRVTIYRTLNTFEELGLIHKILNEDGTAHFAMCAHTCSHSHHQDNHVHFHCSTCKKIYCLDDYNLNGVKVPSGFAVASSDLRMDGLCSTCS